LNYELDTYLDALQFFPNDADTLELARGRAFLIKKDIFKNLMWYTMADSNKHYPLSIESVKKIKSQNKQGIRPEELETAEVITGKPKEVEPEYADLVGQISLKSLEKTTRKRRDKERNQQGRGPQQQRPQQVGGNKPNQDRLQQNAGGNRGPQQQRPQQGGGNRGPQQGGNRPHNGRPQQGGQQNKP
jgi:hypothetical protein